MPGWPQSNVGRCSSFAPGWAAWNWAASLAPRFAPWRLHTRSTTAKSAADLEAARLLQRAFDEAMAEDADDRVGGMGKRLVRWFLDEVDPRRRSLRAMMGRLFRQSLFDCYDVKQRRLCQIVVWQDRRTLWGALRQLAANSVPIDLVDDSRQVLAGIGRDPVTWSRQLVTLHAVQTLSVLDLKTYCDLVAELGEYTADTSRQLPSAGRVARP